MIELLISLFSSTICASQSNDEKPEFIITSAPEKSAAEGARDREIEKEISRFEDECQTGEFLPTPPGGWSSLWPSSKK